MLPIIGLFNATLALYTVPVGSGLARAVSLGIKTGMWNPKKPERIKKDISEKYLKEEHEIFKQ